MIDVKFTICCYYNYLGNTKISVLGKIMILRHDQNIQIILFTNNNDYKKNIHALRLNENSKIYQLIALK